MPLDDVEVTLQDEFVLVMLNPSILKAKAMRQALHAIAVVVKSALYGAHHASSRAKKGR